VNDAKRQLAILTGMNEALRGRRTVPMPTDWEAVERKLLSSPDGAVRASTTALSATFGSKAAIELQRKTLADAAADPARRQAALESLLGIKDPTLPATLQNLLTDQRLRGAALRGLAQYDDPRTPAAILKLYASFDPQSKKDALQTLSSRPSFATALLSAVAEDKVPPHEVSADIIRQLRQLHNPALDAQISKSWGVLRDSPQDKLKRMAQLRQIVERPGTAPDLAHGRQLFNQTCSQCHTLFDTGGHVGPDITGSNRADLSYLLQRVVDPNSAVPNDYRPIIVRTADGQTIIGLLKKEDANAITLQTPNEVVTVPLKEIAIRKASPLGMMPEGLLDNFKDQDVRDLIAYLRSPQQVPLEPAK